MKTLSIFHKKVSGLLLVILLVAGFISCNKKQDLASESAETQAVKFETPAVERSENEEKSEADQQTVPSPQTKIIRNASLRFQVNDYRKNIRNIESIIKRYQGFIVTSNETRVENSLQNSLTIRVPSKNLDNLVEELSKQAVYLDYKNISSEDVSTEFVDISARLKAKQQVEQRYLDLLKQARTIKEILEIETQLRQIREEIEGTQARINYINSQVAYSTVTLEIYENRTGVTESNGFGIRILNALKYGWDILLTLIIGLLNLWPFLLLIPLIIIGFRKFIRKYPPVK